MSLEEWIRVGSVKELQIYPVKSCGQVSMQQLSLDPFGPKMDRRFMITDENGTFITQRKFPKMALIKPQIMDDHLFLLVGEEEVMIPIPPSSNWTRVKVWNDSLDALDCSDEVNQKLSDYLGKPLKLVYMSEQLPRIRTKQSTFKVGFSDSMPFLIINLASLRQVNQHSDTPVPSDRFRANIAFDSTVPWSEEKADQIKIGDIVFKDGRKCDRCVITTVDQEKAIKKSAEPLMTLRKLRPSADKKIYFGMRYIAADQGKISLEDPVFIKRSAFC